MYTHKTPEKPQGFEFVAILAQTPSLDSGLAYNLVRLAMREAAQRQAVPVERISFVDALRWLLSSKPLDTLPHLVVTPRVLNALSPVSANDAPTAHVPSYASCCCRKKLRLNFMPFSVDTFMLKTSSRTQDGRLRIYAKNRHGSGHGKPL
jgi:hypothetical protein